MMLMLDAVVKGSVVLAIALGVAYALRRRSAAVRHRVLAVAVVCAYLLPVAALVAPEWQVPVNLPPLAPSMAATSGDALAQPRADGTSVSGLPRQQVGPNSDSSPGVGFATIVAGVWLGGTVLGCAVLLIGLAGLARVSGRATPVTEGPWLAEADDVARELAIGRTVAIRQCDDPSLLVTWGWRRPVVLVPCTAAGWSPAQRRIVLRHELAHVARGDWIVQLAAAGLRCVQWFNPLAWWICARLGRESEQACDDLVINAGISGSDYATELLAIARRLLPTRTWVPAPAIIRRSSLERRVCAMLDTQLDRRPASRPLSVAISVALATLTLGLASAAVAQTVFSTFTGSVVDPSDAPLPATTLILTHEETGERREVVSDAYGRFEFVGLRAGDYTVETRSPGFRALRGRLTLSGQTIDQQLRLEIGTLIETITVTGGGGRPDETSRALPVERRLPPSFTAPCNAAANTGAVRVGGNLRPPVKLRHLSPTYPEHLQDAGTSGIVILEAAIGTDGRVDEIRVLRELDPGLVSAATDAVRQWEFTPTLLNCVPVPVKMTVNVHFTLDR